MLAEMDDALIVACIASYREDQARKKTEVEKRKEMWERLEKEANLQPVTGRTAVLVSH